MTITFIILIGLNVSNAENKYMNKMYNLMALRKEGTYIRYSKWCSGSCSQLVIRGLWVRIPLGGYAPRQGILATIVYLHPCAVLQMHWHHDIAARYSWSNNTGTLSIFIGGYVHHIKPDLSLLLSYK